MQRPFVTLITDASWCPQTKIGGWAAWWKSGNLAGQDEAPFKTPMVSSTASEMAAAVKGLSRVVGLYEKPRIVLQMDNTQAIRWHMGRATAPDELREIQALFHRLRQEHDALITFRHIKAHSGTGTPRTWVHDLVDRRARQMMREARTRYCVEHGLHP